MRPHTLHVRGGSVSRRGLTQLAGNHAHLAWARKSAGRDQAYSQLLFGRGGLGERRFSQRSGLSPRVLDVILYASPTPRVRGGSVSRRGLIQLAGNHAHLRMGAQVSRKNQAYSQLLFGRGGLGERRLS